MNPVTSIFELIKQALAAVTAYLELKRESFFYDATNSHLKTKNELREEIIKLRNKGTIDATDRADILGLLLEERENAWQRVSATYSGYKSGDKGGN